MTPYRGGIQTTLIDAYERLADSVDRTPGFNGKPV